MVLKAGRKKRFTFIKMTAWTAQPVAKKQKTSISTFDVMMPLVLYIAKLFSPEVKEAENRIKLLSTKSLLHYDDVSISFYYEKVLALPNL